MMLPTLIFFLFAGATGPFDQTVGILTTTDKAGCLMIHNAALRPGTPLTLLHGLFDDAKPLASFQPTVGQKLAADCDKRHGGSGEVGVSFYRVMIPAKLAQSQGPDAIVYTGARAQQTSTGWLLDGVPAAGRNCTSHEGVHATLWSGKPLASKRLWHFYYYLGMDADPSCTDKDTDDK